MEGLHYPWKYIDCKVVDLPFSWNGVTFRFTHLLESCQWSPFISWFHVNHYFSLKYKNDSIIISVPGRAFPDGSNILLSAVDNMWCAPIKTSGLPGTIVCFSPRYLHSSPCWSLCCVLFSQRFQVANRLLGEHDVPLACVEQVVTGKTMCHYANHGDEMANKLKQQSPPKYNLEWKVAYSYDTGSPFSPEIKSSLGPDR